MCDDNSKALVMQFLADAGFTDIRDTNEISETFFVDIIAKKGAHQYGFEVKERSFPSDKYGDVMCEVSKYDRAKQAIDGGFLRAVYLVSVFSDNSLAISNIMHGRPEKHECPHHTILDGHEVIEKQTLHIPQERRYEFTITSSGVNFSEIVKTSTHDDWYCQGLLCSALYGAIDCPKRDSCELYAKGVYLREAVSNSEHIIEALNAHWVSSYSVSENCEYYKYDETRTTTSDVAAL